MYTTAYSVYFHFGKLYNYSQDVIFQLLNFYQQVKSGV